MNSRIYSLRVRVLLYEEDGEICAHALEMDLLGYGKTDKEAISELSGMIKSQISFARFKNDDSLLLFPADKEFYERWETSYQAALKKEVFPDKPTGMDFQAVWIDIDDKVIEPSKIRFKAAEMPCA